MAVAHVPVRNSRGTNKGRFPGFSEWDRPIRRRSPDISTAPRFRVPRRKSLAREKRNPHEPDTKLASPPRRPVTALKPQVRAGPARSALGACARALSLATGTEVTDCWDKSEEAAFRPRCLCLQQRFSAPSAGPCVLRPPVPAGCGLDLLTYREHISTTLMGGAAA